MSNKTYLFLIRNNSDIDHTVPVIDLLHERGVHSSSLIYCDLKPHNYVRGLRRDKRIVHLKR